MKKTEKNQRKHLRLGDSRRRTDLEQAATIDSVRLLPWKIFPFLMTLSYKSGGVEGWRGGGDSAVIILGKIPSLEK